MNQMLKIALSGLIAGGVGACESPTLFRSQPDGLSPMGPQSTGTAVAPRSGATTRAVAQLQARTVATRARPRPVSAGTSSKDQPRVMIFDVRDLLVATPNFVAPEMDVFGSGGEPEWPERLEAQAFIDEGALLDALRAALPEDALSEDSTMRIVGGRLFVTNPPK